jgi:hypothetical protein
MLRSGTMGGVELVLILGLILRRLGDLYKGIILSGGSGWQEFVDLAERRWGVDERERLGPRRVLERVVMIGFVHVIAKLQIVIPRQGGEIGAGWVKGRVRSERHARQRSWRRKHIRGE